MIFLSISGRTNVDTYLPIYVPVYIYIPNMSYYVIYTIGHFIVFLKDHQIRFTMYEQYRQLYINMNADDFIGVQ